MGNEKKLIWMVSLFFIVNTLYCQRWREYADSAKMFGNKNQLQKAVEYYYKSKGLLPADSVATITYAQLLINISSLYYAMGQFRKQVPVLLEANPLIEKLFGQDHAHSISSRSNLAIAYTQIEQYEKAEPIF